MQRLSKTAICEGKVRPHSTSVSNVDDENREGEEEAKGGALSSAQGCAPQVRSSRCKARERASATTRRTFIDKAGLMWQILILKIISST